MMKINDLKIKATVVILFVFLYLFPCVLMSQQVITGRITDAADSTPITGASVFISNTTIGTASDASGNYSLTVPGRGSFEIVVSHVSYRSAFHKIDTPQDVHKYDVSLETNELDEIIINAPKNHRKRDVDLFWREILGEKPSKKGMEVLNPEKMYFYLNSDNVLKAICREPLEIINHHTGYRILYVLASFEHDYRTGQTGLQGMSSFEELVPANSRQKANWEKKRQQVYAVSLTRFIRSLYREQIREEGFLLIDREVALTGDQKTPVPLKDILQVDRGMVHVNIEAPLLLICYSVPVTDEMIRKSFAKSNTDVRYDHATRRYVTVENRQPPVTLYVGTEPMTELLPQQITVYPDGSYTGLLEIREHQSSIFGLSARLPAEYGDSPADSGLFALSAENASSGLEKAGENITAQIEACPQEKIHLHTDRDLYVPGEKLWFKAYITDAQSHVQPTYSEYAYAELISSADTIVNRVMITQFDGMFHGNLSLPETVPEGNYTLRAYTRYLENLGDDYFFKKNIRIGRSPTSPTPTLPDREGERISPSPTLPDREGVRDVAERHAEQNLNSPLVGEFEGAYDVTFYPEGGNLPEGILSKIAFKALNNTGYPESVTGYLIDESGTEIAPIQTYHAGMGVFTYLPVAGKKYFLKCSNENGMEKQFELPKSNPHVYSLAVSLQTDKVMIGVQKSDSSPDMPCYLLVHCRGNVLYFSEWAGKQTVSLPTDELPAGVIQILLLDGQMNPLSERLVFSSNDASEQVDFHADKDTYQVRDKIVATLSLFDVAKTLHRTRPAHFSIAVTDDKDIAVDESSTILSSLLLSSELKGYIDHPAYYLQDPVAMDLLMMTHGWRRYNIPEAAKGCLEQPKIPFQEYQGISGRVETVTLSRPVRDSEIMIMMQNAEGRGFRSTITDANGLFTVQDLDFPDSTTFFVQALSINGRDDLIKLSMDNEAFPALAYAPHSPLSRLKTKGAEIKEEYLETPFITKADQRVQYDEDMWSMHLDEVVVSAQRIVKRDEFRLQYWANSSSDKTITKETIEEYKFPFLIDYLRMLPGITVVISKGGEGAMPGDISIYFASTTAGLSGGRPALLIIDGVESNGSLLATLRVNELESIDAFSGIGATVFGVRGAGGAISITTKQGGWLNNQIEKTNNSVFNPLGYQNPVEFYAPKYETLEARRSLTPDYRTTIFWKPDVVLSDDGEASFEFYSADFPTTYSVVIEGITDDGKIVRQVEKIQVK